MINSGISAISPLTGREARPLFSHSVLDKYDAHYFYDDEVGYIFVSRPHWLQEAYSSAIAVTDTGIVMRNARNVNLIERALVQEGYPFSRGVDLGGGHGLFVRGMRDIGFDFYWTDNYAENLFARGFEAQTVTHSVAAAFEVLEHLENPLAFLRDHRNMYRFDTCFFSATCFDEQKIPDSDWWYWAFETGQHISFYSERALQWMARQLEMQLWHIKDDVYAFRLFLGDLREKEA
jgi:hypothetical protein